MVGIRTGYESLRSKQANQANNNTRVSFKGANLIEDTQGNLHHAFYLPTNQKADLEIVKVKDGKVDTLKFQDRTGKVINNSFKLWTPQLGLITPDTKIYYKFKVNGQDYLDNVKKENINGSLYNAAPYLNRPNLQFSHSLYHLMPANFNPPITHNADGSDVRATHFTKCDGRLEGIAAKLDYIKDLGAARIISTPVIGDDSSHGYWTKNALQIAPTLGTANEFKNIQVELFKRGMGWVSDGAFVNEGWEGIHMMDLLRHGDRSYAKEWFETFNFPDNKMKIGVLPKDKSSDAYKSFDIKIINGPVKIGKNGPEENKDYNSKKPTEIQVYDSRLVTEDQKYNQEVIRSYPIKNLQDKNAIKTYQDSVQPLVFDVDPNEVKEKISNWKQSAKAGALRDKLLEWKNFEIVPSNESGGATLWDGSKDIAKLRFLSTANKRNAMSKESPLVDLIRDFAELIGVRKFVDPIINFFGFGKQEKVEKADKGMAQVQDYVVQIGGFWTKEIDKSINEYAANKLGEKLGKIDPKLPTDKKAELIFNAIKELAQTPENGTRANVLPEKINQMIDNGQLSQKHIENMLNSKYNPVSKQYEGSYNLKTSPLPMNITDELMSHPLDSIEFPREICSILSSPDIKKLATKVEDVGKKSRYEFINSPEYKNMSPTYKELDEVYKKQITPLVKEVIESSKARDKFLNNGELTTEGKELFRLIAGDLVKYVTIKALANMDPTNDSLEKGGALDYSDKNSPDNPYKTLYEKTYKTTAVDRSSPEAAASSLVNSLKSGLSNIKQADKHKLAKYIEKRVTNLDADVVKVSKLLINKTESGLEWRIDASKDVADIDAIRNKKANFKETWEDVIKFWNKFNTEVRKHNPKAYTIGEVTDVAQLIGKGTERFKTDTDAESKFTHETGFTTPTNYTYLFSSPARLVHGAPEKVAGNCSHYGDNLPEFMDTILLQGWNKDGKGVLSELADVINFAHVSPGNHDKPRLLHALSIDIGDFFKGDNDGTLPQHYNPEPVARAMVESANKALSDPSSYKLSNEDKQSILNAIDELAKGENKHYFAVRPFEHNWEDVIAKAGEKSESIRNLAQDKELNRSLQTAVYKEFITPGLEKYNSMVEILTVLPGNPTIYAGEELGETGFETPVKNMTVQNRNRLHWEKLDQKAFKDDFIIKNVEEVGNKFNRRNVQDLSPLVNGHHVPLKKQDNNNQIYALYKYNSQTDLVTVINTTGLDNKRNSKITPQELSKIDLSYDGKHGLPGGLQEGVIYKNEDKNDKANYIVRNNTIVREDGGKIAVKGATLVLHRAEPFVKSQSEILSVLEKKKSLNVSV